jgi:hypothetical protein
MGLRVSLHGSNCTAAILTGSCPLMGWSGRAPAPPVTNLARGSKDKGRLWKRYRGTNSSPLTVVNWRMKPKTRNKKSGWRRWPRFGRGSRVSADRGSLRTNKKLVRGASVGRATSQYSPQSALLHPASLISPPISARVHPQNKRMRAFVRCDRGRQSKRPVPRRSKGEENGEGTSRLLVLRFVEFVIEFF